MPYEIAQTRLPAELFEKILDVCIGDAFRAAKDEKGARAFCRLMLKMATLNSKTNPPIQDLLRRYREAAGQRLDSVRRRYYGAGSNREAGQASEQRVSALEAARQTIVTGCNKFHVLDLWISSRHLKCYASFRASPSIAEWYRRFEEEIERERIAWKYRNGKQKRIAGTEHDSSSDSEVDNVSLPPKKRGHAEVDVDVDGASLPPKKRGHVEGNMVPPPPQKGCYLDHETKQWHFFTTS